jgi:TATA-box binding protein (TBP) (component of TFIID and TFIIIB)
MTNFVHVTVTNMAAKMKFAKIPLQMLSQMPGVRYDPRKFPCAFVKLTHGAANVFSTGTVTFIGYKSYNMIVEALLELKAKMGKFLRTNDQTSIPIVTNIAVSFSLDFQQKRDLSKIYTALREQSSCCFKSCSYHPDMSNNIVIEYHTSMRILLHSTGRGIATGSTSLEGIEKEIERLRLQLKRSALL